MVHERNSDTEGERCTQGNDRSWRDGRLLQWNLIQDGDCWEGASNPYLEYTFFCKKIKLYRTFPNFICDCN